MAYDPMGDDPTSEGSAEMNDRIEIVSGRLGFMAERLIDLGIIGAAISVHVPGCRPIAVARGHTDLQRSMGLAHDHLFQIGSQTKMFVAVAVHILVKLNLLSYEDPVARHLPEIETLIRGNAVTVAHLLTHTSGIGSFTSFLEGLSEPDYVPWPIPSYSFEDILALARAHGVQFAPGARMLYCDTGYVLLGKIVERLSGRSLAAFLRAEILLPLGLNDTFVGSTGEWPRQRMARGYYIPAAGDVMPVDTGDVPELTWAGAAGDMIASLGDMIRFARAMMDPGNPTGVSIGDFARTTIECWDAGPDRAVGPDLYHGPIWGLGMMRQNWGGRQQWGHRGSTFGYRSSTFCDPDNGVAVSSFMTSLLRPDDPETAPMLLAESDMITAAAYFGACDIMEFA